jgi:hypothetical protein
MWRFPRQTVCVARAVPGNCCCTTAGLETTHRLLFIERSVPGVRNATSGGRTTALCERASVPSPLASLVAQDLQVDAGRLTSATLTINGLVGEVPCARGSKGATAVMGQYPRQRLAFTDSLAEYPISVINATKNHQVP